MAHRIVLRNLVHDSPSISNPFCHYAMHIFFNLFLYLVIGLFPLSTIPMHRKRLTHLSIQPNTNITSATCLRWLKIDFPICYLNTISRLHKCFSKRLASTCPWYYRVAESGWTCDCLAIECELDPGWQDNWQGRLLVNCPYYVDIAINIVALWVLSTDSISAELKPK